ncbi:MAG: hypothetical protein ACTSSE_18585 [Candidatus Thorarchaeota archaeon]
MSELLKRYFKHIFGTYEISDGNKDEIIERINNSTTVEEKRNLRRYVGEVDLEIRDRLGLSSRGKYPKESDSSQIEKLEKQHETIKEILRRISTSSNLI